jgi:hypothetical protein
MNDSVNDSGDGDASLRRSEYLGPQPEWSDTEQVVRLWSTDESSEYDALSSSPLLRFCVYLLLGKEDLRFLEIDLVFFGYSGCRSH